ncbi:alkylhydroperoxidase AhpD family core domain-containing protein [Streptomyces sp. DvalAA-14]|uniref:carboxymuconolactone decarboxylase family protein n=1 Tax=unclassified Streptomyces TaxID=2593676 RepID=UPI00081B1144|nr:MULTISPECIES: carboxymuconolactone decarboxylase family protein [unclassified Streptomyces]MYS21631.1 hypothetical protein [Streptomyces sp. SID4948]SCD97330.1 alkylhydroperoxidase AhpD family core domain-containing protein [Streptomyces sp. DvalAA-14]
MPEIVKYVTPVAPRAATGVVGEVYSQSKHEVGRLVEAVTMFSADPELLAATWAGFREPLLATGAAPRVAKEAIAATVSQLNECPFCVDAHTIMLYGGGAAQFAGELLDSGGTQDVSGEYQALVRWARATSAAATATTSAPFTPEQTPEFMGVLVYFHFLNRVINVLLNGSFLPGSERAKRISRRVAGKMMAKNVGAVNAAGASVGLRTAPAAPLPADLAWASGSPAISAALAWVAATLDRAADRAVPTGARAVVEQAVRDWQGETMPLSAAWADVPGRDLPPAEQPAARLALLAALAPHQVTERDVVAYRIGHRDDTQLLGLLSWAAFTAARRVGSWTAAAAGAAGPAPAARTVRDPAA